MRKTAIFIFYILFAVQLLYSLSSDAYILCYTDKKKMTIGDKVKLTLIFEYTKDIKFGQFDPEENLKSFEIKNYKISKERKKYFIFGRYIKKYEYILSTFTTGIYEINPFVVNFTNKDGTPAQSQTNSLKIEVTSLLDKESASDIRDIKSPVNIKRTPIFYIVVFGVPILLLSGYFIYKYYFRKSDILQMFTRITDPYKYATEELSKLENMDLIKNGMIKEFFVRLTQIVRVYLSKVFDVNITDMTTSESVKALREKGADKRFLIKLREFLECADLVKFAKYIPEEKDIYLNFESAKDIVEIVKPPEVPDEQELEVP
ncbi:MAG: hypothetical protein PHE88_09650 [Elusimicrobia bacterium]|nr:hypothetical protein [Elusimicrobiota bacterium]